MNKTYTSQEEKNEYISKQHGGYCRHNNMLIDALKDVMYLKND